MNRLASIRMSNGSYHRIEFPDSPLMAGVVDNIFGRGEYPPIPFLQPNASVIVDIGANIGCTAVHFASQYPTAAIYALEPAAAPFEFLRRNTAELPQVRTFQVGAYNKDASADLFLGPGESLTNSLVPNPLTTAEKETIALRRISSFLAEQSISHISLLKIDTEGAEVPILEDLQPSFGDIDSLFVEYHSEADRLAIDRLLSPRFTLFSARAEHPHRGTWCYVSRLLVGTMTRWNLAAISPPQV